MNIVNAQSTIYSFKVEGIEGKSIDFASFKGKYILIVNVASKCGFTPQYADLEKLYKDYKDKLVVIGFPCNQFLWQEPGGNNEILSFCRLKYDVTFPMCAKIDVKGKAIAPIYDWLTHKSKNGVLDATVSWNFNKFLVDPDGHLLEHFASKVKPLDNVITDYIK